LSTEPPVHSPTVPFCFVGSLGDRTFNGKPSYITCPDTDGAGSAIGATQAGSISTLDRLVALKRTGDDVR